MLTGHARVVKGLHINDINLVFLQVVAHIQMHLLHDQGLLLPSYVYATR
jgi:hypothetical protein